MLRWAAGTDTGRIRARNEDSAYAGHHLLAVADGLGGHVAGEVASATVINTLRRYDRTVPATSLVTTLSMAIAAASTALAQAITLEPALDGMGTTLVAVLHADTEAALASIGDSRAYRLRHGRLIQLTEDHLFQHLVADAAQVPSLPGRLARFLDGRADGRSPDLIPLSLQSGDRLLLCSDGLSAVLPEHTLTRILSTTTDPATAVTQMIDAANTDGGPDNITLIVADLSSATPGQDLRPPVPQLLGAVADQGI